MKYDGMYRFLLLAFSSFVAFVCGWLLNSTVLLHFCCCCYCYSIREFCDECMCVYVCQCRRMEFALTDQPTDRPINCLTVLSNVYLYVWVFMCVWVCAIVISLVDCVIHFIQNVNRSIFPFFCHTLSWSKGLRWGEGDWLSLPNNLCIYFANSTEKRRNSTNEQTNTRERTPSTNFVATTSDSNNLLNGLDRNLCVRFDPKKVASKLLSFAIENNWSINVSVVVIVVCCSVYGSLRFPRPVLYVVVFCVIYKFTVTCLACWLLLLLLLLLLL